MRALFSVFDKSGVVPFAQGLESLGIEIISTGGTYEALKNAGITVKGISDVTGFPEGLDGRVKTLHPSIHAGLLAMRNNAEHMEYLSKLNITPIDILVVNLYPFKQTVSKPGVSLEYAIENIDIGGPAMLRAAAKNYQDVSVVVDPADYDPLLAELKQNGSVNRETNFKLAVKVFRLTAHYDTMIAAYLGKISGAGQLPDTLTLTYEKVQDMRYGENPHQSAAFYREPFPASGVLTNIEQLHGKELSFNNINDTHGALELLKEFDEPTVVACKHGNPCGVGSAATVYDAYTKAYSADPVSIFGGVIVCNREIDESTAAEINRIFVEILLAPSFTAEALEILKNKKNIRILKLTDISALSGTLDLKKVSGGLLAQTVDAPLFGDELKVVTKRAPTESELEDLKFAWKLVKHTKSNGIAIGKNGQSLGIGPGQVNRIWAAQQAIEHGVDALGADALKGAAMASDAFFPFPDCVEAAAQAGITAIIQPGGSVKDRESIELCDSHGIAMVFTGMRHFKH